MSCIKQMLNAGLKVDLRQARKAGYTDEELLIQTYDHVRRGFGIYASLKEVNARKYSKYIQQVQIR